MYRSNTRLRRNQFIFALLRQYHPKNDATLLITTLGTTVCITVSSSIVGYRTGIAGAEEDKIVK